MNVVLASASPRRASLLSQVGIKFQIDPSSIRESIDESSNPDEIVQTLAKKKAESVAKRHPNSFIIAADTIVCLENRILGKPENADEAEVFLRHLSGNAHDVYSGVYSGTTDGNGEFHSAICFSERTKVMFSSLSDKEINHYIQHGKPFDKAGSYGIQDDLGSLFVKKIEGDYYNVVGFPLHRFYSTLQKKMPALHNELFFPSS